MSHTSAETCRKNANSSAQPEATDTESAEVAKGLRRSERTRTLTEKGKELQGERLKSVHRRYRIIYEKWRYHARIGKEILTDDASEDELKELIGNIDSTCSDVKMIYEELRQIQTPEPDLRRRVDSCISLSGFIIRNAERQLMGHTTTEDEEPWPDVGSILDSTGSLSRPLTHRSKHGSTHSSIYSVKRNEAAAEAAASREVLAVLDDQAREATELQRLESENLAMQQAMQDKRRKLERLEEVKKLNAARARVKVYDQVEENSVGNDLLDDNEPATAQVPQVSSPSFIPQSLPATAQALQVSSPPFIPQSLPVTTQVLQASSPPFIPQSTPVINQAPLTSSYPFILQPSPITSQGPSTQSLQQVPQVPPTSLPIPQVQNSYDLVNVLVEAISANRLPTPEPVIFTGDPLKFKDWRLSFETLIDRKNIPKNEKLYYLRKYLGGAARKAVEGFFLLGTEAAYDSAWQLLEKRFGDPFIIGKSFRDKLNAWPKNKLQRWM